MYGVSKRALHPQKELGINISKTLTLMLWYRLNVSWCDLCHAHGKTCKTHIGFTCSQATQLLKLWNHTYLGPRTFTHLDSSSYSSSQLDEQLPSEVMYSKNTRFHLALPYLKSTFPCLIQGL